MAQGAIEQTLEAGTYLPARFPLHVMEVEQGPLGEHAHEFWEMVYVRRGRGEHRIEGRRFALAAGDVYIIRPGEHHAYAPPRARSKGAVTAASGSPARIVNVLWMPSLLAGAPGAGDWEGVLSGAPLVRLSGRSALRVESLLDEMQREQYAPGLFQEPLLRHLFCTLLLLLARAAGEERAHLAHLAGAGAASEASWRAERAIVEAAVSWIEANHRRAFKVSEVASQVSLSPSRLCHLFKAHTGRGVIEYLHEHRVARAASLLCSTRGTGAAIAREVGFGDPRFFRRVFARHTGFAPADFRRHFAP